MRPSSVILTWTPTLSNPIIKALQADNICVWYDEGIEIGAEWPETIGEKLLSCQIMILALSVNSLQSSHVRREANLALSSNKNIFIILLDEVELSPGMKLQFGLTQMISMKQYSDEKFYEKLKRSIIKELNTGNV